MPVSSGANATETAVQREACETDCPTAAAAAMVTGSPAASGTSWNVGAIAAVTLCSSVDSCEGPTGDETCSGSAEAFVSLSLLSLTTSVAAASGAGAGASELPACTAAISDT